MSYTPSRRALVKGAAWAAPAVIATATIPAYAASKELYGLGASYSGEYTYNGELGWYCKNTLTVTNSVQEHGRPAGLSIHYPEGQGKVQSATISDAEIVWYLPSGWVTGFEVTSGYNNFEYLGSFKPNESTLTLQGNNGRTETVSTYGYTAYAFKLKRPVTVQTQPEGSLIGNSATYFTAEATGFEFCNTNSNFSGYVANNATFTTDSGFSSKEGYSNRNPFYNVY